MVQYGISEHEGRLRAARGHYLNLLGAQDRHIAAHGAPNPAISLDLQQAALTLTRAARDMTVFAFDFAGTNVVMRSDPLQRCLRDIFAGLKHAVFTPASTPALARRGWGWACRWCDFDSVSSRTLLSSSRDALRQPLRKRAFPTTVTTTDRGAARAVTLGTASSHAFGYSCALDEKHGVVDFDTRAERAKHELRVMAKPGPHLLAASSPRRRAMAGFCAFDTSKASSRIRR